MIERVLCDAPSECWMWVHIVSMQRDRVNDRKLSNTCSHCTTTTYVCQNCGCMYPFWVLRKLKVLPTCVVPSRYYLLTESSRSCRRCWPETLLQLPCIRKCSLLTIVFFRILFSFGQYLIKRSLSFEIVTVASASKSKVTLIVGTFRSADGFPVMLDVPFKLSISVPISALVLSFPIKLPWKGRNGYWTGNWVWECEIWMDRMENGRGYCSFCEWKWKISV